MFDLSVTEISFESDNGSDHRAGTIDSQAEKSTRKSGFACIALLSCRFWVNAQIEIVIESLKTTEGFPVDSVNLLPIIRVLIGLVSSIWVRVKLWN